jgi:hypothetical protein
MHHCQFSEPDEYFFIWLLPSLRQSRLNSSLQKFYGRYHELLDPRGGLEVWWLTSLSTIFQLFLSMLLVEEPGVPKERTHKEVLCIILNYNSIYSNIPLWGAVDMEYLCHKWPRICSTCRKHFTVLSSFMTHHRVCN